MHTNLPLLDNADKDIKVIQVAARTLPKGLALSITEEVRKALRPEAGEPKPPVHIAEELLGGHHHEHTGLGEACAEEGDQVSLSRIMNHEAVCHEVMRLTLHFYVVGFFFPKLRDVGDLGGSCLLRDPSPTSLFAVLAGVLFVREHLEVFQVVVSWVTVLVVHSPDLGIEEGVASYRTTAAQIAHVVIVGDFVERRLDHQAMLRHTGQVTSCSIAPARIWVTIKSAHDVIVPLALLLGLGRRSKSHENLIVRPKQRKRFPATGGQKSVVRCRPDGLSNRRLKEKGCLPAACVSIPQLPEANAPVGVSVPDGGGDTQVPVRTTPSPNPLTTEPLYEVTEGKLEAEPISVDLDLGVAGQAPGAVLDDPPAMRADLFHRLDLVREGRPASVTVPTQHLHFGGALHHLHLEAVLPRSGHDPSREARGELPRAKEGGERELPVPPLGANGEEVSDEGFLLGGSVRDLCPGVADAEEHQKLPRVQPSPAL
jgi:hypothetical protein